MGLAFGSRRRGRSRQYAPGQDTARRIRAAAIRLFAERGFAATTTRELADAVEIWPSVLYHYVGTKDELLEELLVDGTSLLLRIARSEVQEVQGPVERLTVLVIVHVMVQVLAQDLARVVDREVKSLTDERRRRVLALRDEYERIWKDVLAAGVSAGVFEPVDAHLSRLALLEMCNGVTNWYSAAGPLSLEEIAVRYAELALDLAGANRRGRRITVASLKIPAAAALRKRVEEEVAAVELEPAS